MTKLGAIFPQTEIGNDTGAIREYAQATESLGYDFLLAFDHVLGANAETHTDLTGPYRHYDAFHEPFVLFGYLAAVTSNVELATGIIILPQRQTALVAKQAAAVDVLSNGRLRLGIGVGWNHVEYEALNENWRNRGARSEEQIDVMRQLWTNELITYEGKWHKITDAGILPLPVAASHPRMARRRIRPHRAPHRRHWRRLDTHRPPRRPRQRTDRQAPRLRRGSGT